MQQLKINSFQKIKYFFRLMCQASIILVLGIDLTMLKRIVLDLSMRELSLNHIQQHLEYIYCYPMSHESIISIQQETADKAHPINHTLDKAVACKISIAEADEVFQGETVILGCVAKGSNYLLGLHKCVDRTKESIEGFLRPIARRFFNIKIVITDLFSTYKTSIINMFKKAIHLVCQLHAGRLLHRSARHLSTTLTQHKKDLEKNERTKTKNANQIDKLTLRIAFLDSRIQKDEAKFTILSQKRGATQSQHTKTMDPQLDVLTNRMQKDKENIKMLGIQLAEAQKIQKISTRSNHPKHKSHC